MTEDAVKPYTDYVLPPTLVSKIDVSRLVNEAEKVDLELTGLEVRAKTGAAEGSKPVMSDQLNEFITKNDITLDNSQKRSELIKQLHLLKDHLPVIHMTFAVTADRDSLQQLANWLRASIHPQAVIEVGLQPALVAGVYLRTANQVKDLSVRGVLQARHGDLVTELEGLRGGK